MHEKMKLVLSRLSASAKLFLPAGLIDTLMAMAQEIDSLRAEINAMKKE